MQRGKNLMYGETYDTMQNPNPHSKDDGGVVLNAQKVLRSHEFTHRHLRHSLTASSMTL